VSARTIRHYSVVVVVVVVLQYLIYYLYIKKLFRLLSTL
jgi:hypothetical protein